ncbi:MAG: 3-deoxy-D-manno-octulosonate 8-phosphate phosphatase [Chlorobiaceae bacterium]|jgi:3-deoxy-D-manno-octulosonate 8-phosphate phosphatase (KDO 8-P phosphatase)|nr:3-deoxy-D-manno-octulosonate 8-phosphate phosphatase [Chlorobiaceae bacterium]
MQPYQADPSSQISTALDGIKALVISLDGVLSNGTIALDGEGREMPGVYCRDMIAIREALRLGMQVAVIAGRDARAWRSLLETAGPVDLYLDGEERLEAYESFKSLHGLQDDDCAGIADDIEDLEMLKRVGLPVTPINGADYLRNRVAYISVFEGGRGCIREIVEMILEHQGRWEYSEKQPQG